MKAAQYLLKNFKENGNKFYDRSVVGTGHRGFLNLQYPVYAYSFPLTALGRLKLYIEKKLTKIPINEELMWRTRNFTQVIDANTDL